MSIPTVEHFFDSATSTLTYLVYDKQSRIAIVIDPVLGFDLYSGRTSEEPLKPVCDVIEKQGLKLLYALDTHAHADHMTALPCFKEHYGAKTIIGKQIVAVQKLFSGIYDLGPSFIPDGSQFDLLLDQGETLDVGPLSIKAYHTPGHTPACSSYQIDDMLFVGDLLFMPDHGTARCDFPGGSSELLYDSVKRLYQLPEQTRVFTCHDYQPGGRELRFESTIGQQRQENKQLNDSTAKAQFVAFREERDATLRLPKLMLAVLQVNIRAGELPPPAANGTRYLKLPINAF